MKSVPCPKPVSARALSVRTVPLVAVVALAAAVSLPALAGGGKTSICHLTSSATNPYTIVSVSDSAVAAHTAHGDFTPFTVWLDGDGDGYGDTANPVTDQCEVPDGYAEDDDDCDDANAAVNPGATEVEGNGLDDDCDASTPDEVGPECNDATLGGRWSFDGDLLDGVGSNDATMTTGATYSWVTGVDGVGQALRYDANATAAHMGSLLADKGTGDYTVAFWFQHHGDFYVHFDEFLFSELPTSSTVGTQLWERTTNGSLAAQDKGWFNYASTTVTPWLSEATPSWHHIAMGREAGVVYLCVDGNVEGTSTTSNGRDMSGNTDFYLGANPSVRDFGGPFRVTPGTFDELQVYDGWVGADGCRALYESNGEACE